MVAIVKKKTSGGMVKAIASKSQAHRYLICAALANTNTQIDIKETSEDIDATIRCLTSLGASITKPGTSVNHIDQGFSVEPVNKNKFMNNITLDCGESGSTLRFMLPIVCALGVDATFKMSGRLPERPLSPLYEELIAHGCELSPIGSNPLKVKGQLQPGNYEMKANVSSQFISGLLFALPLLDGDSTIRLTGQVESKNYIDLTLQALADSGIEIIYEDNAFHIKGRQIYRTKPQLQVEGDWSNAAFALCAGAITDQKVTCTNLHRNSLQGDKEIVEILRRFGAAVETDQDTVAVSGKNLKGIEIDAKNIPDLVPVLALVASLAEGGTIIKNAGRLRMKESDRLITTRTMLTALGADITETEDGLVIQGKPHLTGGTIDSFGDHRIAMTAAIATFACENPVVIKGAEAVNKSYPGFFEDIKRIGAEVSIEY